MRAWSEVDTNQPVASASELPTDGPASESQLSDEYGPAEYSSEGSTSKETDSPIRLKRPTRRAKVSYAFGWRSSSVTLYFYQKKPAAVKAAEKAAKEDAEKAAI
jgi:hypothetical protein